MFVLERGVPAFHRGQHPVGTALHGQVQEAHEFGHVGVGPDQAAGKLQRVRGRETDAVDAVNRGDVLDQQREVGFQLFAICIGHEAAVGIHVLSEQVDLAHALSCEARDFGQDVFKRPADLLAARIGHHAETAVLAAALHDRHERGRAFRPGRGQVIEFFDFGKTDINHARMLFTDGLEHLRQAVNRLRTEHEIDIRRALLDGFALLARHAAAHADNKFGLVLLPGFPAAELGEHLFLGFLADRAGIQQKHVGFFGVVGEFKIVGFSQHVGHLVRVIFVHLAAECLDIQLARHQVLNWLTIFQD